MLMKKKFELFLFIPNNLMLKNQRLSLECEGRWREAKKKNNYNKVRKLKKIGNVILKKNLTELEKIIS